MVEAGVELKAVSKDDNLMAALAYLLTIITGLVVYLMYREKDNRFVKFHALQAIMFGGFIMLWLVGGVIIGIFIGFIPVVGALINLLGLLVWLCVLFFGTLALMALAYSGRMFKLPLIGRLAEKHAG